jgi:polyphosphate kinase
VRYCHIGTGNYNPKTARLYEDLGLLTCDPQVGEDLTRLFNQLSGIAPRSRFKRLLVAPRTVRSGLIDLIDAEIARHAEPARGRHPAEGQLHRRRAAHRRALPRLPGRREVDVWVRGICAIRPGCPASARISGSARSLGRFLEHSRVFCFGGGGNPQVYIGSADMMHRNLDRRVEALLMLRRPEPHRRADREPHHAGMADTTSRLATRRPTVAGSATTAMPTAPLRDDLQTLIEYYQETRPAAKTATS